MTLDCSVASRARTRADMMVNGNVTTLGPRKSRDKEGVANPSIFISMVSG